jgi:hypothetical protein
MSERFDQENDEAVFRVLEAVMRMLGAVAPDGEAVTLEEILPEVDLMLRITAGIPLRGDLIEIMRRVIAAHDDRFAMSGPMERTRYLFL